MCCILHSQLNFLFITATVALVYVLRFSFPGKKILGLVYKCYSNELLMS